MDTAWCHTRCDYHLAFFRCVLDGENASRSVFLVNLFALFIRTRQRIKCAFLQMKISQCEKCVSILSEFDGFTGSPAKKVIIFVNIDRIPCLF